MGFYYSDDPVRDYERKAQDEDIWLNSLPKCEHCDEPIQDDNYYEIEGCLIHEDCIFDYCHEHHRKTNNYL